MSEGIKEFCVWLRWWPDDRVTPGLAKEKAERAAILIGGIQDELEALQAEKAGVVRELVEDGGVIILNPTTLFAEGKSRDGTGVFLNGCERLARWLSEAKPVTHVGGGLLQGPDCKGGE
jgi:hypothetical protein